MSEEPPGRVEWNLTSANDDDTVTRVTLRHGDLAHSPKTWDNVRIGWVAIIDGMKTLIETGQPMPDVTGDDKRSAEEVEAAWHRIQAMDANNATWELLDGRTLTPDEADDLLGRAYAAMHHWRRAAGATPVNAARAAWLVSRSHAVLGQGELALHHAERSAQHVSAAGDQAADFDHAYAHEATARALACLGRLDEARAELTLANAVEIADPEDRAIIEADIKSEPWFGL
jgi:hypothetical protein